MATCVPQILKLFEFHITLGQEIFQCAFIFRAHGIFFRYGLLEVSNSAFEALCQEILNNIERSCSIEKISRGCAFLGGVGAKAIR